jgi:hypothetical protein
MQVRGMRNNIMSYVLTTALLVSSLLGCSATAQKQTEPSERQKIAVAMFAERCKRAGEFIHRTVDNVDGVFLLKLRPSEVNYADQFALDDPYGRDLNGDGYIESFVRGSYQANTTEKPAQGSPPRLGYLYVDAIDPKDRVRYRYTGRIEEPWQTNKTFLKGYMRFVLSKEAASGSAPRYGVTYEDISTREEREYWIAGSSLKVVDLQINEVIAERVGYMMDVLQGSRVGGRSPWLFAANQACPTFFRNPSLSRQGPAFAAQARQAQDFVGNVLKPQAN